MAWAPDYCTVIDLRRYVGVDDDADDAEMDLAIAAASRAVDRSCNRQFGQDTMPTERRYTARRDPNTGQWSIPIDDLMTVTGLEVAFDSGDTGLFSAPLAGYGLRPLNAIVKGRPWTSIQIHRGGLSGASGGVTLSDAEGAVQVTGLFGWSWIPDPVVQATLMQASRFLARRGAPFGIAGSPDAGSEMRLLAKLDPDVEVALAPYRRWWTAA